MSCVWVECVLNVLFSGENSSVQQHRCGKSLPGQRQRQVPPRHDHLPVTDHLPTLEQSHRRRQVGVPTGKACIPVPSSGGPLLHHRWKGGPRNICRRTKNKSTWFYGFIFSLRAGRGRTRMKRLLAFQQRRFSKPFTGLCFLCGFCGSCDSIHVFFFIITQI